MSKQPPGWYPDPADASRQRWWDGSAWSVHVASGGSTWTEAVPELTQVSKRAARMPIWAWLLIGTLALVPMLLFAPIVAPLALIVLVTGVVALSKGTATWLRLRSRKAALIVTSAAAVILLISGSVSASVISSIRQAPQSQAALLIDSSEQASAPSTTSSPKAMPKPKPTPTPVESTREEVVTEVIPFTETRADDSQLPAGRTQLRTAGQNGEKSHTYLVHLLDGKEVSRELVSEAVTKEPVTQVVANGTYVAPPPPAPAPPSNNCDPNYADGCVPIASDVDCAGGSGNGPAYFNGTARVVGRDIYGLDRDGDGIACER